MSVVAIDFGTTTVSAALLDDHSVRLAGIDGSPLMPSAVYLTNEGRLAVGREAERQARRDPSRYEPSPKRRVDEVEILLGAVAVPTVVVIAAVLRRAYDAACGEIGTAPTEVRLTHPARWGPIRQAVLLRAAESAQLEVPVRLVPEPVAAATHFASQVGRATGTPTPTGLPAGTTTRPSRHPA